MDKTNGKSWFRIENILAFVGILVGFASLAFMIHQRTEKAFSYQIISNNTIVNVSDNMHGKLQVYYDGKQVQSLNLLVMRVINTGNVPIHENDYRELFRLNFEGRGEVKAVEILDTDPKSLRSSVPLMWQYPTAVQFPNVLLNPEDSVTFEVYFTGPSNAMQVDAGRIEGVKDIREIGLPFSKTQALPLWLSLSLITLVLISSMVGTLRFIRYKLLSANSA